MSHVYMAALCGFLIVILLITIVMSTCTDGFRSPSQKINMSHAIVNKGEPVYSQFKNMGLDGVEYYDAKQLWNKKKYNVKHIRKIL
jgi:hypothetical protein